MRAYFGLPSSFFMTDYHQPEFYRFNEDSIKLATMSASIMNQESRPSIRVLDLGCGCGVVGMELARSVASRVDLYLCEAQVDYQESISVNVASLCLDRKDVLCHLSHCSWGKLAIDNLDLIISNPPYFLIGHGQQGTDLRRERARRWSTSERDEFYQKILALSNPQTKICLCLRDRPPQFFMDRVVIVHEEVFNERESVLTIGIVFALNIEADK